MASSSSKPNTAGYYDCMTTRGLVTEIESRREEHFRWEKKYIQGFVDHVPDVVPDRSSVLGKWLLFGKKGDGKIQDFLPDKAEMDAHCEGVTPEQVRSYINKGKWRSAQNLKTDTYEWLSKVSMREHARRSVTHKVDELPWLHKNQHDSFMQKHIEWMNWLYPTFAYLTLRLCSGIDQVKSRSDGGFQSLKVGSIHIAEDAGIMIKLLNYLDSVTPHEKWPHDVIVGRARHFINKKLCCANIAPVLLREEYRRHCKWMDEICSPNGYFKAAPQAVCGRTPTRDAGFNCSDDESDEPEPRSEKTPKPSSDEEMKGGENSNKQRESMSPKRCKRSPSPESSSSSGSSPDVRISRSRSSGERERSSRWQSETVEASHEREEEVTTLDLRPSPDAPPSPPGLARNRGGANKIRSSKRSDVVPHHGWGLGVNPPPPAPASSSWEWWGDSSYKQKDAPTKSGRRGGKKRGFRNRPNDLYYRELQQLKQKHGRAAGN